MSYWYYFSKEKTSKDTDLLTQKIHGVNITLPSMTWRAGALLFPIMIPLDDVSPIQGELFATHVCNKHQRYHRIPSLFFLNSSCSVIRGDMRFGKKVVSNIVLVNMFSTRANRFEGLIVFAECIVNGSRLWGACAIRCGCDGISDSISKCPALMKAKILFRSLHLS